MILAPLRALKISNHFFVPTCLFICLVSCSSQDSTVFSFNPPNLKGEYIYRYHDEHFFQLEPPKLVEKDPYLWEMGMVGGYPKITKDFFRCKGCVLNPVHLVQKEKEVGRYYDCGGSQKHSLPLKDQKEFIYPVLIELLNYLQNRTGKRVVITCGHCCLDHNSYLDPSLTNQNSKHLIGAEVDFYIQGMEHQPQKIVDMIISYYEENPKYKGLKEFEEFQRYDKEPTNVTTLPWYNKEIFIKLYKKTEGRDFDNRHPYPYIGIQVRYDWDLKEKVSYSWDKAFHNLHR